MSARISVMIVDDSALARQALTSVIEASSDIAVMATAGDPFQAAQRLKEGVPDVLLLDLEMPRMDGLTFLRRLMRQHPIPTIICSSLAEHGSPEALTALELGAVDVITKPAISTRAFFLESAERIHDAIRAAAQARVRTLERAAPNAHAAGAPGAAPARSPSRAPPALSRLARTTDKVVVVGASTGGTEALREFLQAFASDAPGIVIVQHMPPGFTAGFAKRLDGLCRMRVKEAESGDVVRPGIALIGPGDRHLAVRRSGAHYHVEVFDAERVNRHRPSVDVLFHSAAEAAAANAIGVIMTGMGDDGARGMRALRDAGAQTIAQDEATCVVYGMPKEAVKLGGVEQVLPLGAIAHAVLRGCA